MDRGADSAGGIETARPDLTPEGWGEYERPTIPRFNDAEAEAGVFYVRDYLTQRGRSEDEVQEASVTIAHWLEEYLEYTEVQPDGSRRTTPMVALLMLEDHDFEAYSALVKVRLGMTLKRIALDAGVSIRTIQRRLERAQEYMNIKLGRDTWSMKRNHLERLMGLIEKLKREPVSCPLRPRGQCPHCRRGTPRINAIAGTH